MKVFIACLCFVLMAVLPLGSAEGLGPDTVNNFAGFIQVNETRNLFFTFFESRSNPEQDPVVLWLSGGPGCSSLLAMFYENGPYTIKRDLSLEINPYSWNEVANVLWIDQPVGTGYSYNTKKTDLGVLTEDEMATDLYEFLQKFFSEYPMYYNHKLFIFGESYAGHYVPAISSFIVRRNLEIEAGGIGGENTDKEINLAGIGIGNGLVDPATQYQYYSEYAFDNSIVSRKEYLLMKGLSAPCVGLINKCDQSTTLGWTSCFVAYDLCNFGQIMPIEFSGLNPYDIRLECGRNPLCYDFSRLPKFLEQDYVKEALGVGRHRWKDCNHVVDLKMVLAGDWMMNFAQDVPVLLDQNIPVLVYSGDQDFICNWYGGEAWANDLQWSGHDGFNEAKKANWMVNGESSGTLQSFGGLSFLRVYDAGHMVPKDKPEIALQMVREFLSGDLQGAIELSDEVAE